VKDYNAIAFKTAMEATNTSTFAEASSVLAEIDTGRLTDSDVQDYVSFCKELSQFCIDHGIQRSAELNLWSVLKTADHGKTAKTLLGRWWKDGIVGPIKSAAEGAWLAARLRPFFDRQERLAAKYLSY